MQPKVGKLDIDYQVLHDAFFKHQTKPHLTRLGEIYYEGKEFEARVSSCLVVCMHSCLFLRTVATNHLLPDALFKHQTKPHLMLLGGKVMKVRNSMCEMLPGVLFMQKQRGVMCQVVHDAVFKHQIKPCFMSFGKIYPAGKDFEAREVFCLVLCMQFLPVSVFMQTMTAYQVLHDTVSKSRIYLVEQLYCVDQADKGEAVYTATALGSVVKSR